jgi:pilus assembly protein CpaE
MGFTGNANEKQVTALLVAPDRELVRQFSETLPAISGFQILAELRKYPSQNTLEIRLRQLKPEVVLLDLATDFEQASEVIRAVIALDPAIHVIGLHVRNDSEAVLRALRQGASEFLFAPFDAGVQRQALARIKRLINPQARAPHQAGTVVAFTSAKPGSGASTLAVQLGLALGCDAGRKILVADLDPMAATAGLYLLRGDRVPAGGSDVWSRLEANPNGPDFLPAGGTASGRIPAAALRKFLERARSAYDWVILDLPAVFHRSSLLALPEADQVFLVTTAELPSLHLARKAVNFLGQLGFGRNRIRVLVNRVERRSGLTPADFEKILNTPVHRSFSEEYSTVRGALAGGRPVPSGCPLGKEIANFAGGLSGLAADEKHVAHGNATVSAGVEARA